MGHLTIHTLIDMTPTEWHRLVFSALCFDFASFPCPPHVFFLPCTMQLTFDLCVCYSEHMWRIKQSAWKLPALCHYARHCVDCVVYLSDSILIMDTKNALQCTVCTVYVLIFKLDDKCSTRHKSGVAVDDESEIKIEFLRLMAIDAGSSFISILMVRRDWIFVHSTVLDFYVCNRI